MILRTAINKKTSMVWYGECVSERENGPLKIRPTHDSLRMQFQMENEKDGGDWKRKKNWKLLRTKNVIRRKEKKINKRKKQCVAVKEIAVSVQFVRH
jgi:hypothetical protein